MSMKNPNISDAQTAANYGLGNFRGDLEAAEDLGIATTPEDVERQFATGQELGRVLSDAGALPSAADLARQADHARDQIEFRQTGAIPYSTAAQREIRSARIAELRSHIPPKKGR